MGTISICRVLIIAILCTVVNGSGENVAEKSVICHFKPNSLKRPAPVFDLDDFDPTLCTHFIYHGAMLDEKTPDLTMENMHTRLNDEEINGLLNKTMSLRERNPQLKILVGMCCFDDQTWVNNTDINKMITSFKKNVVLFLQAYGFDGLSMLGIGLNDHISLATALRQEFDKHGYILAKFVYPTFYQGKIRPDLTHDMVELHDLIFVGSYWKLEMEVTGMISSLAMLRRTIERYMDHGIRPEKLVVVIPGFSTSYYLLDRNNSGVSAPIISPGEEATSEAPKLILQYNEIMQKIGNSSEGWVVTRDNATGMMYGHSNSNLWTTYEDSVSVRAKAQYIIENNLAGGMILNLDNDDFVGYNEEGIRFPLTRALHEGLRGN